MRCTGCFLAEKQIPQLQDYTVDEIKDMYKMCMLNNGGRLIVHGMVARASVVNSNHRKYPKRILKRELNKFIKRHVKNFTALGELDHPSYSSPVFRYLNLPNITHQVLELQWRGECVYGVLEVLDSSSGRFVKELFQQGCPVGVSTRGWASVKQCKKAAVIQSDFDLITLDFVPEPSTNGAFVIPMIYKYEGVIRDQCEILDVANLGVGALPFNFLNAFSCTRSLKDALITQMRKIKQQKHGQIKAGDGVQVSLDICEEDGLEKEACQKEEICESIHAVMDQEQINKGQQSANKTNGTHDQPTIFTQFLADNKNTQQIYYSCYQIDPDFACHNDRGIRNYADHLKNFRTKAITQAEKLLKYYN